MKSDRTHSRGAGILRVVCFSACVLATCMLFKCVKIRAEVRDETLRLGRGLGDSPELRGHPTLLRINGSSVLARSSHVALPPSVILDRFEKDCGQSSDEFRELSGPAASEWQPVRRGSHTLSRTGDADEGAVVCWLVPGDLRYAFARKAAAGGADVVAVRTQGSFDLLALVTVDGDVPGKDIPDIPRPPGSRRVMDVEVDQARYGLKAYATTEPSEAVMSRYAQVLAKQGWTAVDAADAHATSLTFLKREAALVVSAQRRDERTLVDLVHMGSQGTVDLEARSFPRK